ncbi:hypothetical protein [Ancylobacter sp.]|uniref:hypothetical protein n=1 Tax=Ancylobacter sp. TaxID=1872567 RepID=UPI003D147E7F
MTTMTSRAAGAMKTGLVALTLLAGSVGIAAAHGGGGGFGGGGFHGGGYEGGGFHGGGFPGGYHDGGGYFPHGIPFHNVYHNHGYGFGYAPFFGDYAFGPYSSYLDEGPACSTALVKVGTPHHRRYVRETNCG